MVFVYEERKMQLNLVVYIDENTKYCKIILNFLHIECKITKDCKWRGYADGFEG